jgi:hypothetical protein
MDMANMKVFEERDYIEALSYINVLPGEFAYSIDFNGNFQYV